MPENESFVHDLLLPDSNTRRFHAGDACQWSPPVPEGEVMPEVAGMIAAHRAEIHAPGSRAAAPFGLDEEGNPIETSYLGVGVDPESGALYALDADGNRVGDAAAARSGRTSEKDRESRAESAAEARASRAGPVPPEPKPDPKR